MDARKFQLLQGLKLDVWAAEPQLSNSVAFCFDGRGRVFLAESDRWAISVFDITAHTNWLLQDMSFRSVGDRAGFLTHEFATNLTLLTKDSEAVRMLEDRDGDGRADHTQVVATGFNSVVDGTAAGVLASREGLYFANIPSLWRLPLPPPAPAENWKLKAENLASGFGVHIGVSGHDLHGLIKGPDGRIYMSFGDRGCVLTNREGVIIQLPDTGGVLRCEPDGRNLEVFCHGLRNPQELAFDDLGNLWTVDNDTAGADPCRVLHLVEGGDYGWRTSYQHMEGFGPWVQEALWTGGQDGILPPAGTVSQGPSGLAFYPGTGFGDRLKGTFLHADFPGGVWAFTVKPQGASYGVDHKEKFLWNCWPTDVDFGPDGGAYILDWVSGWGQTPRGRIYRITPSTPLGTPQAALVTETRRLLGEGMATRGEKELLDLLGHADRRVRLEAQWELAGRGTNGFPGLRATALGSSQRFARIHALWAVGQMARPFQRGEELSPELHELMPLLEDRDEEVKVQAILLMGETQFSRAYQRILDQLRSKSTRVQWAAAAALGRAWVNGRARLHFTTAEQIRLRAAGLIDGALDSNLKGQQLDQILEVGGWKPLQEIPRIIAGIDPPDLFLQNAVVRFLMLDVKSLDSGQRSSRLQAFEGHSDADVRITALLARRRLHDSSITNFLSDPDPELITAAGRAIHDVPIAEGFPALASFITKIDCPTNLYSRVINACYRLGTQQHAQMLAGFAGREDVPDWARVLAMRALGDWEKPSPLDRVNGLWRPLVVASRAPSPGGDDRGEGGPAPRSATAPVNPLLERAAQAQTARNLGRAAELPVLPPDLGRSASYAEAMSLRRNPAPAQRAFLRVAGDVMNPSNLNEAGQPAGTREVLALQIAVADAAATLRVKEAGTPLYEKFANPKTPALLREAIVPALVALNSPLAGDAVKAALSDPDPRLRAAALPHVNRIDGGDAVAVLSGLVPGKSGELKLAQAALLQLGRLASRDVQAATALRRFASQEGGIPPGLRLDLLEALRTSGVETLPATGDRSARYEDCLEGGDPLRGREVFFNNPTVQCLRCHTVSGQGGTVGPELTGIGGRQPRGQLLESLVIPNARIAEGFESVVLSLSDGRSVAGMLKRESDDVFELEVPDPDTGEVRAQTVQRSGVVARVRSVSAMPEGLAEQLSLFEIRDLVAYLAGLK